MLGCSRRRLPTPLLSLTVLFAVGCAAPTEVPPKREMARLVVQANVAATSIATMVIKVSAGDITPALVFNLPISGPNVVGEIEVPAGSNRKLELEAFDANGIRTHEGGKTIVAVRPGAGNDPVSIQLNPVPGQQPVVVTFGNYAVTVTGTLSVAVGGKTPLSAEVKGADGQPVAGAVALWATSNPAIATVSASGEVTGVTAGTVKVVATYKGVGGEATVTVRN